MAERDERQARLDAAYAAYTRLLWRLVQLPDDAPGRADLAATVAAAEHRWRTLAGVPRVEPTGRVLVPSLAPAVARPWPR